jgi:hypothetical protein
MGTTTVQCAAVDQAGNVGTYSWTVTHQLAIEPIPPGEIPPIGPREQLEGVPPSPPTEPEAGEEEAPSPSPPSGDAGNEEGEGEEGEIPPATTTEEEPPAGDAGEEG